MDPNVFRKGDASSCLVVDKAWKDVYNKPDFFTTLAEVITRMAAEAKETGIVHKATSFGEFKRIINQVLLTPLREAQYEPSHEKYDTQPVMADAFWSEIEQNDEWAGLYKAIEKAYVMRESIIAHRPLVAADKLQDVKDNFNETVIEPMLSDGVQEE